MDTEWFAVDADGHLGWFDTGESGAVPAGAAKGVGPDDATLDLDAFAFVVLHFMGVEARDPEDPWDTVTMAEEEAVPLFRFSPEPGGPPTHYARDVVPARPMKVDDLPDEVRSAVAACRWPSRFAEVESLDLDALG